MENSSKSREFSSLLAPEWGISFYVVGEEFWPEVVSECCNFSQIANCSISATILQDPLGEERTILDEIRSGRVPDVQNW